MDSRKGWNAARAFAQVLGAGGCLQESVEIPLRKKMIEGIDIAHRGIDLRSLENPPNVGYWDFANPA
jgi:hypothetical protein